MPTSWTDCSRRWAVTTTSDKVLEPDAAGAGAAGASGAAAKADVAKPSAIALTAVACRCRVKPIPSSQPRLASKARFLCSAS